MGLDIRGALDRPPNCRGFTFRNHSGPAGGPHDSVYAWRRNNLDFAVRPATKKHVARKQGQRKPLRSILPPMNGGIERHKNLKSFAREQISNGFLVLVSRVKRVPKRIFTRTRLNQ